MSIEVTQVKLLSASGHYFVYVGARSHAAWKWSEVYPGIPFNTVSVTTELVY
jgi:hypothetical protein